LRERIPDTRTFQPRGLLPRSRFDFGTKLKWKAPPGPAIVLTGTGTMKPGKARVLACVGKAAPAFWWKALVRGGDWKKVKPALEGKVVILHVWASWIPPCAAASRALEEFARDLPQDKAAVLGISIDTERKSLDAFLKQRKVTLPTVWDRDNEAVRSFGLPGAPAYLVLDARRVVRFGEVGWFGDKTLGRIDGAAKQALK